MPRMVLGVPARCLCVALAAILSCGQVAYADPGCGCNTGCNSCGAGSNSGGCGGPNPCQRGCCPPCWVYYYEGPPKIKFCCGCPAPICPPTCETPGWGYYQTCWRPWPWTANYAHCPVPPPAAFVPQVAPLAQAGNAGGLGLGGTGGPALEAQPRGGPSVNPEQRLPAPRRIDGGAGGQ